MNEARKVIFNSLDREAEVDVSYRNLPHWFQVGAAMFVTFRTADSLPREVLLRMKRELEEWLASHKLSIELAASIFVSKLRDYEQILNSLNITDRKQFRKRADQMFHGALDECHGKCILKRPELASLVANAILRRDGEAYDLASFVVMPNHVSCHRSVSRSQRQVDYRSKLDAIYRAGDQQGH